MAMATAASNAPASPATCRVAPYTSPTDSTPSKTDRTRPPRQMSGAEMAQYQPVSRADFTSQMPSLENPR